ncbi:MAG: glycosyltransferase family 4 protein [Aquisalimonadaceae bacterium]
MKVLMTALWPVGGIRTFFRYIYGRSIFNDLDLHLIAPDQGLSDYLNAYLPPDRITLHPCEQSGISLSMTARSLLRAGQYDIVHSHGFSAGVATELAVIGHPVPHMLTAHDVFLHDSFIGMIGRLRHLGLQTLYKRIDLIHAVTEDGARNICEFMPNISSAQVRAILHGIDTDLFCSVDPINIRKNLQLPEDTLLIGYFGRFMPQKGFRTLVDAVMHIVTNQLTPRPVRVLTFGWGGYIREEYQYLTDQGLSGYFLQLENTAEPGRWMKGMDIIAMPSLWEACGLLGMEALCAGTPIVGTSCIGLREVLQGSPAPMITPGNAEALAYALVNCSSPQYRAEFEAYQSTAIERFSIDRPARALRDLYEDLATKRGNG